MPKTATAGRAQSRSESAPSPRSWTSGRSPTTWRNRARFFLTFDKDGDVKRQLAAPGLHGRRMHGDAGLIVGGAPPEQAPVAFGRLEWG
jgi:hypothetical protein